MAQGFKPAKKTTSSVSAKHHKKAQQPKKGGRTIPPKKADAVAAKLQREKVSKSSTGDIEKLMVNRSDGKLHIMSGLKEDKPADAKGKGKAKATASASASGSKAK